MSTKPFTVEELVPVIGMKLKELRGEMRDAEQKLRTELRAELEREIAKLRAEFLRDRLDLERDAKRRSSPLPVHSLIELN